MKYRYAEMIWHEIKEAAGRDRPTRPDRETDPYLGGGTW